MNHIKQDIKVDSIDTAVSTIAATSDAENPTNGKKKKKKSERLKEKWQELWQDKRKFRARFFTVLFVSLAFTVTYFVYTPIDIYSSNVSFFAFSFGNLLWPLILTALGVFLGLLVVLSLLKGKIYNYAVSLVLSLTLSGFIQGNFLNRNHGSLDGTAVNWGDYRVSMWLSLLFWAILIIIPLAIQHFSRKTWRKITRSASLMLLAIEFLMVSFAVIRTPYTNVSDDGFLTTDGMWQVSKDNNVIVFLLDRFDKKFADELLSSGDYAEQLNGFTYYDNFSGSYSRTFPSVAYLLTGIKNNYDKTSDDYFSDAWKETKFLPSIKEAGYDVKVYTEMNYVIGKSENCRDVLKNVGNPTGGAKASRMLSAVYTLSLYRNMPEAMKPYYHVYTDDLSFGYIYGSEGSIYSVDDPEFRRSFEANRLSLSPNEKGSFIFYHLQGAHNPFNMDEYGNRKPSSDFDDARLPQVKGDFGTIFLYMDELKRLGVYDNTTIIITADHGETGTMQELKAARLPALFIKEKNAGEAPMALSHKQVCQDNLRASIVSYFGIDSTDFGRTIESIGDSEDVSRYFYMSGSNALRTKRDVNLITYEIKGDANQFDNWEIVSKEKIKKPYYDADGGTTSEVVLAVGIALGIIALSIVGIVFTKRYDKKHKQKTAKAE